MECIVFLGVDGAGKSTVIRKLRYNLESSGASVFVTHFRLKLFGTKNSEHPDGRPVFAQPWPLFIGYFKIIYFIFLELIVLVKLRKTVDILIYDRNLTDCLMDGARYRIRSDKILFYLLRFREVFFPKSKRFILIGDAVEISNRKSELTLEETKKAILKYECYSEFFKATYIDTTKNSPEEIIKTILTRYAV